MDLDQSLILKYPQIIVDLIKRCLDANPLNRPTAEELRDILSSWHEDFIYQTELTEIIEQTKEAEEISNNLLINSTNSTTPSTSLALSYETHSEAIYTSRLLNFNDLPEPKNSDDYYQRYDNIISKEYSGNY